MRDVYDFSTGARGKYAQQYPGSTQVVMPPSPARACTRLVLENRIHAILDEAEGLCPGSVPEFLGTCLRHWEEARDE